MKIEELEKCLSVTEQIIKEALEDNQPGRISDKLIKLATWKLRLGELVAESVKLLQEAETQVEYEYSSEFIHARITTNDKKTPESDAKAMAIANTNNFRKEYSQALWYKTRITNLWRDLETVIDAIKYKVNTLQKEWQETRASEYPGGKESW